MSKGFTLFEIDQAIADLIDGETGEIVDVARFDELRLARETKCEHIALAYKNLCAEVKMLAEQEKIFSERKRAAVQRADNCKAYLEYALGGEKFKTPLVNVYYSKSTSVIVEDMEALPSEYVKTSIAPDKTAIKEAITAGQAIDGARLETKIGIVIR